ncbi:MAG: glycosyltransferase family 39 protein [Chloroflexota bacterium]
MMIFPQKLSKTWNRHYWLFAVVFLLLVIFGLILPHTLYDTPWLDEAYTYQFAGLDRASDISIFETIVLTAQYDPWPPTYYITQNIWHDWMGSSLFVTNLLPAFYGLLAVAVMYQLGRLMFAQAKAGLIAAILFGLSGFAVNYFHETRGYSLMLLAWVVMVYCYWRYLTYQSQNTKRLKLYLTLAVAFALYTHTISLVFMGGIGLYHLLVESRPATRHPTMTRAKWLDMLRALINGGILWIPWLTVIVLQTALSTIPPFVPMQEILVDFLSLASNTLPLLIVPVVFLTLMRLKDNSVRFLWIWLSIAMVGLFIVNYGANSLFHPRHILPLLVIFVLLITRGLLILEQWHPSLMISVMSKTKMTSNGKICLG